MCVLSVEDWQLEATEFFIGKHDTLGNKQFNLRVLNKIWSVYKQAVKENKDWKIEIELSLSQSRTQAEKLLFELTGGMPIKKSVFVKYVCKRLNVTERRSQQLCRQWAWLGEITKTGSMVGLR